MNQRVGLQVPPIQESHIIQKSRTHQHSLISCIIIVAQIAWAHRLRNVCADLLRTTQSTSSGACLGIVVE